MLLQFRTQFAETFIKRAPGAAGAFRGLQAIGQGNDIDWRLMRRRTEEEGSWRLYDAGFNLVLLTGLKNVVPLIPIYGGRQCNSCFRPIWRCEL